MRIQLVGVVCVGKSTIGAELAELLGVCFFDLDIEVEAFYHDANSRLQARSLTFHRACQRIVPCRGRAADQGRPSCTSLARCIQAVQGR
jgi:adenylate kinase family enzyme